MAISATHNVPSQYHSAMHFYNEVQQAITNNNYKVKEITNTGHSLGGGLGEMVSATTGDNAYA